MLTSYAYVSLANPDAGPTAISDIVCAASIRNAKLGVTGAIYSDEDVYFQIIEGEEAVLSLLMSSILRDTRHSNIVILDQVDLSRRQFENNPILHLDGRTHDNWRSGFSFDSLTSLGPAYVTDRVRDLSLILQEA